MCKCAGIYVCDTWVEACRLEGSRTHTLVHSGAHVLCLWMQEHVCVCVCSVCMYADRGLSGNRETLCPGSPSS